jgi:hypothetical protein
LGRAAVVPPRTHSKTSLPDQQAPHRTQDRPRGGGHGGVSRRNPPPDPLRAETYWYGQRLLSVNNTKRLGWSLASPGILLLTLICAVADSPSARAAKIDNARIFPFWASGGGWESTITLINVFESNIGYRLSFYAANGQPALVSYQTADGRVTAANTIQGDLGDDSSAVFVLIDAGGLQSGWARLDYDGESRIAGVLTFRQRVAGRPDFESSVTLTREDETPVYLPFNNTLEAVTSLAITNPSSSDNTDLQLRFWDASGREITTRNITLSARTTTAFSIPSQFPELAGRSGQLRIQGSSGRLSTLALQFNSSGAFSTLPVATR